MMITAAAQGCAKGGASQATPLLGSNPGYLRRNMKDISFLRRCTSQRMKPQALAFGGLAPANLQTELEALERSQGAPQQV